MAHCTSDAPTNVAESPLQGNPISQQSSNCAQNTKNLKLVTGLHRGIRKKSARTGKRGKRHGDNPSSLSFSDSIMEKRIQLKDISIEDMDIRRFVEFGRQLGLCFVGNEEIFASKFHELEERDKGVKRKELRKIVSGEHVNFLMIQETKLETVDENLCRSIWGQEGFEWYANSADGRSGGLLCIWDSHLFKKIDLFEGDGFISVEGLWGANKTSCCFLNVYGPCNVTGRAKLCNDISGHISCRTCISCIGGDFNCVRGVYERKGKMISHPGTDDFNQFIDTNGLVDLPLSNRKFTWYKSDGSAQSRLDRFLLSENFQEAWGDCVQIAFKRSISDHCLISLTSNNANWGPRPFKLIDSWTSHHDFGKMIQSLWNSFQVERYWGFKCKEKLKALQMHLKQWNKDVFGNIDSQLDEALKNIETIDIKCEGQDITEDDMLKRKEGFENLWQCLKKKESLWRQKSRASWIKDGDANSHFFHRITNGRRQRNMIHGVDDKGTWIDDPDQVKLIILDHFKNQFSSQPQNRPSLEHMFSNRLSRKDREMLEAEFTNEEIKEAVFSCASDKAPGPDGFNFHFRKSVWSTIEGAITNFIKEFHKYGRLVRGINASYITLVPKKKNPTTLKEYRPVSMVGSLYKILAKVLANRLRKVIGKVISMTQSAFLEGRQLIDSVLVLNELVHDLKRRKEMGILFKVDFEKAFDSIDWDYLDFMQSSLGFGDKWRGWIKECLTFASVSILVNGSPTQEFKMQKGLRQGNVKLWKKIIVRKYYDGVSSTSISNIASPSLSPFWKDILSIGKDCDRAFGCFDDGFIRKLGDGSNTRFWKDAWMGNSPLMFSYPRLFCLTLSKDALVAELKLGNVDGWAFQWRRPPFGRELDELERLEDSLRNLNLSDGRLDKFIWKHCSTGYSSKQACKFLDDFPPCLEEKCCKNRPILVSSSSQPDDGMTTRSISFPHFFL
ncbi:hypothetical protein SLEP1_g16976 [Rubroshorea leprosula]|uniref:Reverse transcriptase domain-containing protein n=1 Tax=Rubroshorea leprosula TaxID=152421 RepID=A0AAV5IY82_9ROSI|nr:hypothetical protein SLEP1_g16976 [Rubroshorea leprosula]